MSIFWTIVVFFSLVTFTYMSVMILYRSIPELKEMFKKLEETRNNQSNNDH
jgi:hypothetical protein